MTDSHAAVPTPSGDVGRQARDLVRDLAAVSGLLSEIGTCRRRADALGRGIPADRPLRLLEAVGQVEAGILSLADEGADLVLSIAGRFWMLTADFASAQSASLAAGNPAAGDAELRDSAADVLRQAGTRLLGLILAVAAITSWSVNKTPPAGASKPWILIELG